ncbi:flagellar hook-associated protein FlgK [Alkaliphilus hydrothermalis]|uniref:Flagellar hook-associated protein 1 n=1 Tax=Alkaliphilus hydrothermalis TaxID=1482730 RepID=A0ABS2NQY2_9FIRM|nr:flagellar hook-associated protein FlgK [Alkaliphilus hydrothermalis]MBM7615368.1 flagellar hook-associated protein 1 FlgK [Alkaliphilus hydrothermalis]
MRSTFLGFNTVKSGLFAAQRALDITGHNLANVNTKGYTRQRLNQVQSNPMNLPGGQGMMGTGVDTLSITQFRNEFLDFKFRSEVNAQGFWEAKRDGLRFIETIFNEPSETGISTVMDEMFSAFQELSKNPENLTTRALVRQRAIAFTNSVNHMYNQMEKMAVDLNFDINTTVNSINGYGEQIAVLNDQIFRSEIDGGHANDLRDQRNLLIDELSKLVNVEVVEVIDPQDQQAKGQSEHVGKKMVLQINGQPLVSHNKTYQLDTSTEKASSFDPNIMMRDIRWANGDAIDLRGVNGELKALLELRDGTTDNAKGVPFYIGELNKFVNKFAEEINNLHTSGYGLNGAVDSNGYHLFTNGKKAKGDPTLDGTLITAKNIQISLDVDVDLNKIAASSRIDLLPGDGSIALEMNQLRHKDSMFMQGKPEDYIKSLISNLGVDTQEAIRMGANQTFLVEQVDNQRQAISGVSIDEEMSNMVRFQHAYNASARMITTMDEMLDVVINRIGLVGR